MLEETLGSSSITIEHKKSKKTLNGGVRLVLGKKEGKKTKLL